MQTTNYQLIPGGRVNYQMQTTKHKLPNASYQLPIHSWSGGGVGKVPNANYQTANYEIYQISTHFQGGWGGTTKDNQTHLTNETQITFFHEHK